MLVLALSLLTLLLSLSIGFVAGYTFRWVRGRLSELTQAVVALSQRKADIPVVEKPRTAYADPDDPIMRAKFERDEMRKGLNK